MMLLTTGRTKQAFVASSYQPPCDHCLADKLQQVRLCLQEAHKHPGLRT